MRSAEKNREAVPLLPGKMDGNSNRLVVKRETEMWTDDDEEDDKIIFADSKKRGTSLVFTDSAILLVQVTQLFCVLTSLAMRWTWPYSWLINSRFVLFVNLDIWDFLKLQGNGTYRSVQNYHIPSTGLGVSYWLLLLAWGVVIFIGLLVYITVYAAIRSTHTPYLLVQIAKLQRVYIIILQVFAIPFGTVAGRVFHCNANNYVDIDNSLVCYRDHHWAYISPVLALAILLYIVLPVWMIMRTRTELLSMPSDRHEAYLQLKETEYIHGMDVGYIVGHFHLFSSFKKYGAYYRPAVHLCIFVLLGIFAGAHNHLQVQGICICGFLFAMFLAFIIIRPFRLACFNAMLVFSFILLAIDALLGALLASTTTTAVTSVWLTSRYLTFTLAAINVVWLVAAVTFLIYVIIRQMDCFQIIFSQPLWPALTSSRIHRLTPHTQKYVRTILKSRLTLAKILEMPPLFAPANELGRQIHIVNAYCREAEFTGDPMLNSLWDLLDELIESHARIAPKSLFAESVKESIKSTAAELMRIMPMFTRRLAQREYDFLLMRPVKRRLLLKMYCMSLFLNNRRATANRLRLTEPYLQKVWKPITKKELEEEELPDDGYYEDMYPEYESPVKLQVYQPETSVGLNLIGLDDIDVDDDEVVMNEADEWTKEHPLTPMTAHTYTNLVFEVDNLSDISSVGEPSMPTEKTSNSVTEAREHVGDDDDHIDEAPKDFAV